MAEKLLQHHAIEDIFKLKIDDFVKIDGFAEIIANQLVNGLSKIKDQFFKIYELGFSLDVTPLNTDIDNKNLILFGKSVVFTGSMKSGSRTDMEKYAKQLGAKISKSVSSKTDYLVTGEKVGSKKISDAESKGVEVISEAEYFTLINITFD